MINHPAAAFSPEDVAHYKNKYDIFICGGSRHFAQLRLLLPKLHPFGRVHLASITLARWEVAELRPYFDILHSPNHDPDGYINFNLFCIRDINRLATAPHFIKLDADVSLSDDWIEYVNSGLLEHSDAVLFGIKEGLARVDVGLAGSLIRQQLGREIQVFNSPKVIGGFYVGATAFFQQQDRMMQTIHQLLFRSHQRPTCSSEESLLLTGNLHDLQRIGNEDTLRSLVVHAAGAGDRMLVINSQDRIYVPHGPEAHACHDKTALR